MTAACPSCGADQGIDQNVGFALDILRALAKAIERTQPDAKTARRELAKAIRLLERAVK